MPISARKKATNAKWDRENMRTVSARLRKEEAEAFAEYASSKGKTPNSMLREYVRECIKGENLNNIYTEE